MGPKYCFDYWHSYQKESDMVFSEACSENQTISADLIWRYCVQSSPLTAILKCKRLPNYFLDSQSSYCVICTRQLYLVNVDFSCSCTASQNFLLYSVVFSTFRCPVVCAAFKSCNRGGKNRMRKREKKSLGGANTEIIIKTVNCHYGKNTCAGRHVVLSWRRTVMKLPHKQDYIYAYWFLQPDASLLLKVQHTLCRFC